MGVRQGESSYKGVVETFSRILQESGWKGFYRGLGINLVRTVPNSAVTMLT
jgi:solute carrier family 25 folate transporter 32